ncbi:MAG: XTP/dITP diphosphatase [Lachnospiraceae bacterium]|nr:XTP/dITP diphosphatase [Lachnospiraceae bacterium]
MTMDIIMATGNSNKVREIREMLDGSDLNIISMKDAGIDVEIIEDGLTFEDNARIKAETVRDACGKIVIADDSGLEIDFLGGEPGIHSSRFMGEDTSYDIKNAALLEKLDGVPDEKRSARFICAMAIAYPDRKTSVFRGVFEGRIAYKSAGENGFGYDPIFYLPERGCTSAELLPEEKNSISHRGQALKMAVEELQKLV